MVAGRILGEGLPHPLHPDIPNSRVVRVWDAGVGAQVLRAEGASVVYTQTSPVEELESGRLLWGRR